MLNTIMSQEASSAHKVVSRQLQKNTSVMRELRARIKAAAPSFAVTIGRGSSDHACTYAKYLFETKLGIITASAAPSTITVYNAALNFQHALVIGISQSGKSPDICKVMEVARQRGAITVALVNVVDSPLAKLAEFVIPLQADEEKAVAATKSYLASLTALVHLVSTLTDDQHLQEGLIQLPHLLESASSLTWPSFIDNFRDVSRTLVIGRGYGFPIAQEIALKFKETSAIQAEAFSSAELLHGPVALLKPEHAYLLIAQSDTTLHEVLALALRIKQMGGKSMLVVPSGVVSKAVIEQHAAAYLLLPPSLEAIFDPIIAAQTLYMLIAELAVVRGYNPDAPANLHKVTETL
jgi:glutamine---fructose-6-phosphate transaminase (isomerizing)